MGCIYRIYCKSTNKNYIGQSKKNEPDSRYNRHLNQAFKENSKCSIHSAIRKYGKENFELFKECNCETQEELDTKEDEIITKYNSMIYDNGYNMVRGGKGRAPDFHHKEEHKKKMSEFMKNRPVSDETKEKIRKARTGTKCNWSEETRAKVSQLSKEKATGVIFTEERKKKIGEKSKGRIFSEESKKKMSEHRKGKPSARRKFTDEQVIYIRNNPDNLGCVELSKKLNVSHSLISNIQKRKCYEYVE